MLKECVRPTWRKCLWEWSRLVLNKSRLGRTRRPVVLRSFAMYDFAMPKGLCFTTVVSSFFDA